MKISKSFKIYIHIIFVFLISNTVLANDDFSKNVVIYEKPKVIKELKFKDLNLQDVDLTNKKGNIMILNFWATWCVPCKKELPDLSLLDQKLENYKIDVLTISIDKKNIKDQVKFLLTNGASNLTHFFDKEMSIFRAMKLRGVPTTILVDKTGLVISKHEGILKWSEDKVLKEIVNLLN